ncbi:MAG: hypothetical protein COB04_02030 [Gammaproteobacteria bacterium]|nr:MAG: hypothetical protein COB04_02030 [Gammaproteobacteria bacterium]
MISGYNSFRVVFSVTLLVLAMDLRALQHSSYESHIDYENLSHIDYYSLLIDDGQLSTEQLAEVYHLRGTAYSDDYQLQLSLKDFNKGIFIEPSSPSLYGARAIVLGRLGRHDEALDDLQKAIELDPVDFHPYKARGDLYFSIGRYEQAVEDYETYLRVHYEDPYRMIWHFLANEVLTGQGAQALKKYSSQVNVDQWPGVIISMYLDEGSVNQVLDLLPGELNEQSRGQYCEAYFYIGQHYLMQGKRELAKQFFVKAVDTDAKRYLEYESARQELKKI